MTIAFALDSPADAMGDRESILDAALAAFVDFGIRRTNMSDIARRAGISPATLYRRFTQKADLVLAVGVREAQRLLDYLEQHIDITASPVDQLSELHIAVAGQLRSNELLRRVLGTEPESVLPKLTVDADPILEIGRGYLATFLTRLQDEGHLPSYDVTPVADSLSRLAQSEVLTPSKAPLTEAQTRAFVRDHLAPFIRLDVTERPHQ